MVRRLQGCWIDSIYRARVVGQLAGQGRTTRRCLWCHCQATGQQHDISHADVVVVTKKLHRGLAEALRGKLWLFDAVDFYPQPLCTTWGKDQAVSWVKDQIAQYSPTAVIWPNQRMMNDCGGDIPDIVIRHHHRPNIQRNPIRENVAVVGYEGSIKYLGRWGHALRDECQARGWELRTNPKALSELDIVVAFRDAPFNGYAQRHWKSNVKLANAHGSGTPFIGPREDGYIETASGLELWTNEPGGLRDAFDRLTGRHHREQVQKGFIANSITVQECAHKLTAFIDTLHV